MRCCTLACTTRDSKALTRRLWTQRAMHCIPNSAAVATMKGRLTESENRMSPE